MAQPVFYQTQSGIGVDPSVYYAVSASVTPETPAAPFQVGTTAFGSDGSQFVFVQASTAANLGDFVVINAGQAVAPYQSNPVTSTNVVGSLVVGFGATGLVIKQSVTTIPAGAFFWAATRGTFIPAQTSTLATASAGVVLFTSATAGVLTSVTTSSTLAVGIGGIVCINSLTVSIPSSVIPQAGTLTSTGFALGPIVAMNNPRTVSVFTTADGLLAVQKFGF